MASVWSETLSGFKAFVTKLREDGKKDGVEYLFSLTTFDTLVETPLIAVPIDKVDPDVLAQHGPRGCTALYDAVGATIQNTEADHRGAEKIIVVVVTDGQENSSREWTKDRLHTIIDAKLNAGNWTFTYLGTQPETWDDAQALGVSLGSVRSFTGARSAAAYAAVARSVSRLSSDRHVSGSRNLMDEYMDDKEMADAGMARAGTTRRDAKEEPGPGDSVRIRRT